MTQSEDSIVLLGLNHASAPVEVREAVAFSDEQAAEAMSTLECVVGVAECVLLSTCNRTDVYAVASDPDAAVPRIRSELDRIKGVDIMRREEWTYTSTAGPAVEHLFRVAGGLDSQLVGESQILSQVKQSYALAESSNRVGIVLNRLFQSGLHAGKRVRTETDLGKGTVSLSSSAVGLAEKVFGSLEGRTALVVGTGETGRLAAEHLVDCSIGRLMVTNRTYERAADAAEKLGGEAVPFEDRLEALVDADILITATGAPDLLFLKADVERVVRHRPNKPLLAVDLAMPRDVDPEINGLGEVFLHDLDALKALTEQNLARRRKDIPKAESIVAEEVSEFAAWFESLSLKPMIRELRDRVEEIRKAEIDRYGSQFSEEDRARLEKFTVGLTNKILHQPLAQMREFPKDGKWGRLRLDTVRRLFGLDNSA